MENPLFYFWHSRNVIVEIRDISDVLLTVIMTFKILLNKRFILR